MKILLRRRGLPALLFLFCAVAGSGRAGAGAAPAAPASPVGFEAVASLSEARGDYAALAAEWVAALERDPNAPGAELILLRLDDLTPHLPREKVRETFLPLLERLRRKTLHGRALELILSRQAAFLREADRIDEARKVEAELGVLDAWLVAGPFGYLLQASHDQVFAPERALDLAAPMPDGRAGATVAWDLLPVGDYPTITRPFLRLYPPRGAAYVLAQVKLAAAAEALLEVNCGGWHKVWIDGHLVLDGDRNRAFLPLTTRARVKLAAGWHRLLVKVGASEPNFSLRLLDPATCRPLAGATLERGKQLHDPPAEAPVVLEAPDAGREDLASRLYQGTLAQVDAPRTSREALLLRLGLAVALAQEGRYEAALAELDRAEAVAAVAPAAALAEVQALRPWLGHWRAQIARASPQLSPAQRTNLSRAAWRRALELSGGKFVPAFAPLAEQELAEEHPEKALAEYRAAVAAGPEYHYARMRLAAIALALGWEGEAVAGGKRLRETAARHGLAERFWAAYYLAHQNPAGAVKELGALLERNPGDPTLRRQLAELLAAGGADARAEAALRRLVELDPADLERRRALLQHLLDRREYEKAAAAAQELIELAPRDPLAHRLAGDASLGLGRIPLALAAYERALELEPSWSDLRRRVARLKHEPEDFSTPYRLDVPELTRQVLARARQPVNPYGSASRVLTADQTVVEVFADGSWTEYTHQAQTILSPAGQDEVSTVPVPGELLEARTRTADGQVLEPWRVGEGAGLTMPGLAPGATVEYRYRLDGPGGPASRLRLPRWYFRSPELGLPHHLSQYVVIAPEGLELELAVRNWYRKIEDPKGREDRLPEAQVKPDGRGHVIYTWTAEQMDLVQAEPHMEHPDRYLPYVEVAARRSWDEVNYDLLERLLGRTRLTDELRRTAAAETAGCATVRERAAALYRFVHAHVPSRAGGQLAHQVLAERAGDRNVLLYALLEAAGCPVRGAFWRPAEARLDQRTAPADWNLPGAEYFPRWLLCVTEETGRPLWLDASGQFPFGAIPEAAAGGTAFVVAPAGGAVWTLPEAAAGSLALVNQRRLHVRADGTLVLLALQRAGGAAGAARRETFLELDRAELENTIEAAVSRTFPGAELLHFALPRLSENEAPFGLFYALRVPDYLEPAPAEAGAAGAGGARERRTLPLALLTLDLKEQYASRDERAWPLQLAATQAGRDVFRVELDAPLDFAALPEPILLQGRFGSYALRFERLGARELRVTREYELPARTVSLEEYAEFARFCNAVDRADQTRLTVLK